MNKYENVMNNARVKLRKVKVKTKKGRIKTLDVAKRAEAKGVWGKTDHRNRKKNLSSQPYSVPRGEIDSL